MKKEECKQIGEHEERVHSNPVWREEEVKEGCDILRVLGEPSRMKILLALWGGELCVYHIVEAVKGNQSAVSHQLRVLKDYKIIKCRREGQNVLYSIADEHIYEMVALLKTHLTCGEVEG